MLVADGIQLGSLRIFAMFSTAVPTLWAIEITTEFLFVGMAKVTLAVQQLAA